MQVALALVLVVSAALMIRTFQALRDVDPGFSDPATIQTARIWIPPTVLSDRGAVSSRMEHEILDKIAALPGVASVGFASELPMDSATGQHSAVSVEGRDAARRETRPPQRRSKFVSPGYFAAMGTRIIAGRDITWSDIEAGGRVAVISEDFARELAAEPAGALGNASGIPLEDGRMARGDRRRAERPRDGLYEDRPSFVYWPVLHRRTCSAARVGTPSSRSRSAASARAPRASWKRSGRRSAR